MPSCLCHCLTLQRDHQKTWYLESGHRSSLFRESCLSSSVSFLRTAGSVAEHFGPQEEAPLGHHDLSGLYPTPNGDAVATQRPHLHRAGDKLPLLVRGRDEDDLTLADGLHGSAWDDHSALAARRREHQYGV